MSGDRNLILGVETLMVGGAELFVVRLANAMCEHFDVTLVVTNGHLVNNEVLAQLDKRVRFTPISFSFEKVLRWVDRLLRIGRLSHSVRDVLVLGRVRSILATRRAILHTHQFKVDYLFMRANMFHCMKHVLTMHGDYLTFAYGSKDSSIAIRNFMKKAAHVLARINAVAYISDYQFDFIQRSFPALIEGKEIHKIYNGVHTPYAVTIDTFGREFRRGRFVFGMVARGIPEKGWEIAIRAVLALQNPDIQLVLVGQSPYLDLLRIKYTHSQIIFSGFTNNPFSRIQLFDVGLLPSVYKSESLPTSIIEYLVMQKPVIATDVGDVRNMLIDEIGAAGIVLPVVDGRVEVEVLTTAMRTIICDNALRGRLASNSQRFARKFDMSHCVRSYLELYRTLSFD